MKLKYLIIVSLVLAIIAIGAVSASDDIGADEGNLTASSEDFRMEESSIEEVELSTDDEGDVVGEGDLIEDYDYSVEVQDFLEGKNVYISGNLPEDASGTVSLNIDDNDEYAREEETQGGWFYFNIGDIAKGKHNAKIIYGGDGKYAGFTYEKEFTVDSIKVNIPDEYLIGEEYDLEFTYLIEVVEDFEGNVSIYFDDELYKSGVASELVEKTMPEEWWIYYIPISYTIEDLSFGPHTYKVVYVNGDYELVKEGSFNLSYYLRADVDPEDEDFERGVSYGRGVILSGYAPDEATKINITINGIRKEYDIDDFYDGIKLTGLVYGRNNVSVSYCDEDYPLKTIKADFDYVGEIYVPEYVAYDDGEFVSLQLPEDAVGNLNMYRETYDDENPYELIGSAEIVNGYAYLTSVDLNLDSNQIIVKYENGNYDVRDIEKDVFVYPNVILPKTVGINSEVNFTVKVPENPTGTLLVKLVECSPDGYYGGDEDFIEIYNGPITSITKPLPTSDLGTYRIIASTDISDGNYGSMFAVVNQSRAWELIAYFPEEILPGDSLYPDINCPEGGSGKFTIYIDGKKNREFQADAMYDLDLYLRNCSFGTHTWKVEYTGDSYYDDASKEGTFEITWAVVPKIVVIGQDPCINIAFGNYDHDDTVTLKINGEVYETISFDESSEISLDELDPCKTYEYELICGDFVKSGTFKTTYDVEIEIDDMEYEGSLEYKQSYDLKVYLPEGATGTVEVIVNGKTYSADVEDEMALIQIQLSWGENEVSISYSGNDIYEPNQFTRIYSVYSAQFTVNEDGYMLNNISLTLPEDASGNVSVYLDGDYLYIPVVNGSAVFTSDDLPVGTYYLYLRYDGSDYYVHSNGVYVSILPEMNITDSIDLGEECVIEINLPDSSASIEIYVDGVLNGTYSFENGKLNVAIPNLSQGTHQISFNYGGYDYPTIFKYYDEEDYEYCPIEFDVEVCGPVVEQEADLNIEVESIDLGESVTVYITINENVTKNVTVRVSDCETPLSGSVIYNPNPAPYEHLYDKTFEVEIIDGKGSVTLSDLTINGKYNVTASYEGDELVLGDEKTSFFNVLADINLIVNAPESIYENEILKFEVSINPPKEQDSIIINIEMNPNDQGFGFDLPLIMITGTNGTWQKSGLSPDTYDFTFKFEGNTYYKPATVTKTVVVKETFLNPELEVSPIEDIIVGNQAKVTFTIHKNATGKVIIHVGDMDYEVPLTGADSYEKLISDLGIGTYEINVTYAGGANSADEAGSGILNPSSEKYYPFAPASKTLTLKVKPVPVSANLTVKAQEIYEGQIATINVLINSSATGNVTININGKEELIEISEGVGNYTISDLTPGTHDYSITFAGDDYFLSDVKTVSVKVLEKMDAGLTVAADEIIVGQDAIVKVSINENVTGKVSIKVNGEDKVIDIVEGSGQYILSDLEAKEYQFDVSFEGDVKFKADSKQVSVKVNHKQIKFEIEIASVEEGNPITVKVTANDTFTGDVIVKIGENNVLVSLNNGEGINSTDLILPAANDYSATLDVEETPIFDAAHAQTTFNVTAKAVDLDLRISEIGNVEKGKIVTIKINAVETFSGDVKVQVGSINATATINAGYGEANVNSDDLEVGEVTVNVIFDGNKYFLADYATAKFNITAKSEGGSNSSDVNGTPSGNGSDVVPVKIIAKDFTAIYSAGAKYSVTVYDKFGNLAKDAVVIFKINGKNAATVKTNNNGIATLKITQIPKIYKITAEALGTAVTKKLTVKHVLKLKKVKVKRSAKKLVIKTALSKVNGKYLKGKKITLKFKNKKYTAKTNKKGVAKFTIKKNVLKKLKAGKKVKYQATYLKDTVKYTVKVKK